MPRRSRLWLLVAYAFTIINVGGAIFAVAQRSEPMHTMTHVVLSVVGAFWILRITRRGRAQEVTSTQTDEQLDQLQHSVDAIALEVERIGEAQRFIAKMTEKEREAAAKKPPQSQP